MPHHFRMTLPRPLFLLLLASLSVAQSDLIPRCGDCWCIYYGELDSCPTNTTGIVDSFGPGNQILSTFQLTNDPDFLKLQTSTGSPDCFPFADTVGPLDRYSNSSNPQCATPNSTADTVCAYLYEQMDGAACSGRKYQVLTYDSAAAAEAAGAVVTHGGACGVCSSAQDFWIRMKTYDTLESDSIVCATKYSFATNVATRFDALVKCYTDMGFTDSCSILWAHYGATNAAECGEFCIPETETGLTILNGSPPQCALQSCLKCSANIQAQFDAIAGRVLYNSGITERIARPCSAFYRVTHEPCVGAVVAPTMSPAPTVSAPTVPSGAFVVRPVVLSLSIIVASAMVGSFLGA